MKFNEAAMDEALKRFMDTDLWRNIYKGAPELARKRLRVAFWASSYLKEKEDLDLYRAYREQVEREMSFEDADYLARRFPVKTGKDHYEELRDEIELRSLKTEAQLDAACETLLEGLTPYDREVYEKTRQLLKSADEPMLKYEWLWGAVGGDGDAAAWLGDTFDHGHGVEPNEELAFYWFKRAAMCGNGDGCGRLAEFYEREDSPRHDMARALFWFREALRRNSVEAKIDLGRRLTVDDRKCWQAMRNPHVGFELLRSAYAKGEMRAAYFLGKCCEQGVGTKRDLWSALKYYKEAMNADYGGKEDYKRVKKLYDKEEEMHAKAVVLEDSHIDNVKFDRLLAEFKARNGRDANLEERKEILSQCVSPVFMTRRFSTVNWKSTGKRTGSTSGPSSRRRSSARSRSSGALRQSLASSASPSSAFARSKACGTSFAASENIRRLCFLRTGLSPENST